MDRSAAVPRVISGEYAVEDSVRAAGKGKERAQEAFEVREPPVLEEDGRVYTTSIVNVAAMLTSISGQPAAKSRRASP